MKKFKNFTKVPGQLMIWRSGFGCDLVEYIQDSEAIYSSTRVKMLTGRFSGTENILPNSELRNTTEAIFDRYDEKHFRNRSRWI